MALNISVKLVDKNNRAIANRSVKVCLYNLRGRIQTLVSGRTNPQGVYSVDSDINFTNFLPRVLLCTKQNSTWVNLTNTPKSFSSSKLDFGTVTVNSQPTMTVAGTTFHTIPAAFTLGGSSSSSSSSTQLRTLTDKNSLLERKLTNSKKETQEISLKFSDLQRTSRQSSQADKQKITQLTNSNLDLSKLIKAKDIRIRELETNTGKKPSLQVEEFSKDAVISSALEAVNKADTQNKGRFQLKSARMDLKVLSGSTKDKVRLIKDTESLQYINPDLVSTLTLDLDGSNDAAETQATPEPIKMPDLTGYTRSLADRRLDEISVSAQWYNQQLAPSEKAAAGTIISQTPKAGRSIGEDTEVILIIGVAQEEEA
ncbi:PASTA domain-containing protein [Neptuniibacter sp. PT8_73]|uniref:PASTA domain-containing protein n=1 Tax=unclassified Neptuniibacter TaxID=2630693 RepID=UPI0039F6FD65